MSEPDVSDLISVTRAIQIIDSIDVSPRIEQLPLAQSAGGRLAADILADRDNPPFDKALMDGFAVRAADLTAIPMTLPVAGEIPAGATAHELPPGHAIAIMTGAPLPPGADAVIPIEDIDGQWARADQSRITILRASFKSRNIAPRGSDCRAGETVLQKGVLLTPPAIAVAASVGAHHVDVFARPRAGILSTGNEIVPIDESPGPSQIRNSNTPMLASLLTSLGCDVVDLGIAPDDPQVLRQTISAAIPDVDLLFITGGMSMGQHDHVPALLRELRVDLKITKLRIKPGKPFIFATLSTQQAAGREPGRTALTTSFIFGLPGNPVSGFVCTFRLASRLIARMTGAPMLEPCLAATLASVLPANGPREFYQPIHLQKGVATPLPWRGSADIFTLAGANSFLIREENAPALPAGAQVLLLPIPGGELGT